MHAASSRKHIAMAGRLGSGPALGPQSGVLFGPSGLQAFSALSSSSLSKPSFMWCAPRGPRTMR